MSDNFSDKYQTFFPRLGATIIDAIIFLPIFYLGHSVLGVNTDESFVWILFFNSLMYSYSIVSHYKFGKTIGKHFSSIKVVRNNDENKLLSLRQSFLRDIIGIALFVLELAVVGFHYSNSTTGQMIIILSSFLWIIAEIITMLFSERRRSIHDYIANSVCIKINSESILETKYGR